MKAVWTLSLVGLVAWAQSETLAIGQPENQGAPSPAATPIIAEGASTPPRGGAGGAAVDDWGKQAAGAAGFAGGGQGGRGGAAMH